MRSLNTIVFATFLVVASFVAGCNLGLKIVPPDYPEGRECLAIWMDVKDEQGNVDMLKSYEASYFACQNIRDKKDSIKVPIKKAFEEVYAASDLDYHNERNKWIEKAYQRLKRCSGEEKSQPSPEATGAAPN